MNNTRRAQIRKALEMIEAARDILEEMADEEQECFDNMPEGLQESERGETLENNAYELTDAYETLENVMDAVTEVIE